MAQTAQPKEHAVEHHRKLERMYAEAPTNEYFASRLIVERGAATVRIAVRPDFHHAAGAMHGAVYFKALDDATYFAANSLVTDVCVLTARFEIEFLHPVTSGEVCAVGRVTDDNGHRIEASGELHDDKGRLVGRGKGLFARSKLALQDVELYR